METQPLASADQGHLAQTDSQSPSVQNADRLASTFAMTAEVTGADMLNLAPKSADASWNDELSCQQIDQTESVIDKANNRIAEVSVPEPQAIAPETGLKGSLAADGAEDAILAAVPPSDDKKQAMALLSMLNTTCHALLVACACQLLTCYSQACTAKLTACRLRQVLK